MRKKLPIGIQGFEKIRTDNFLYVDKTAYVYQLVHNNVPYFFSRPRRFGKSLLLSTIRYYFEGRKDLFKGLAIEKLEEQNKDAWQPHPVFYFDFNGENYKNADALQRKISFMLNEWENDYNITSNNNTLSERFQILIKQAYKKSGYRCVILVDEYDKPLLDVIENEELTEHNKEIFKGFFSTLKSHDEYIQFIFITGVSKFHKVSIFSDLNQLKDISLTKQYASLCGITDAEIHEYFEQEVLELAEEQNKSKEECLSELKNMYDGYRFHQSGPGVYNPYSLLSAFADKEFGSFWFETGTPTFLVKLLKTSDFDIKRLNNKTIYADEKTLKDYSGDSRNIVPLLYQTGYLTIADYDPVPKEYTLAFPNDEVKYSFIENLANWIVKE